jgi:two-component system cell cycle response regulator
MSHLGSLLLALGDNKASEAMAKGLENASYNPHQAKGLADTLAKAKSLHPDLILIDDGLEGGKGCDLARTLKSSPEASDIPIFILSAKDDAHGAAKAIEAGADDFAHLGLDLDVLSQRLRPLLRLSTMHAELKHRAQMAKSFGLDVPPQVESGVDGANQRLLVVSPDSQTIAKMLPKADIVHTADLFEAETLLAKTSFDACLLDVTHRSEEALSLCSQIRNNTRLFNLPVLLIASPGLFPNEAEPFKRGASRVLHRPLDKSRLDVELDMLVRRQRLRWKFRDALMRTHGEGTKDDRTAAYGKAFLNAYLGNRLALATSGDRHLSVMYFNIPNITSLGRQFGLEAAELLLSQLANWIIGLLRAEDLTARTGETEFCLVLPDTPIEEAVIVMHRISSVLTYTDFAVPEVYQPVKVWVEAGSAYSKPGDTVETLLARAHAHIF